MPSVEKKLVPGRLFQNYPYYQFTQKGRIVATVTPAFVSPTSGIVVGWIIKIGEETEGRKIETLEECERIIALL